MSERPSKQSTGEKTLTLSLDGDKLYQKRARKAFPILVRQAKVEQTIFYSDLAVEIGMPNPRNLNYVLGTIGNAIKNLNDELNTTIPPIQCLVINRNTGMPGKGIEWFIPDANRFKNSTAKQKRFMIQQMLIEVFQYEGWENILAKFGLEPLESQWPKLSSPTPVIVGKGGESEQHRLFKEFVAANPQEIYLSEKVGVGEVEFELPSADIIDVLFRDSSELIGVEVKAKNSNDADIVRGIYQCIKYQALLEAVQMANGKKPFAKTLLVIEGKFPEHLFPLKNLLGVEVREVISTITANISST